MQPLHTTELIVLVPHELAVLRAGDYGLQMIRELSVEKVRSPGEPSNHMLLLNDDVRQHGIKQPIVLSAPDLVVDGHHRAVLALLHSVPCPALLIHCTHENPLACVEVRELCEQQHRLTQQAGWEWALTD